MRQYERYAALGGRSVLRVVTVEPTDTEGGRELARVQEGLLAHERVIDNPLRAYSTTPCVAEGLVKLRAATIHSGMPVQVSLHSPEVYLGSCRACKELCGVGLCDKGRAT